MDLYIVDDYNQTSNGLGMDMKEIITAWIIKAKPNDSQKKLAEERYQICEQCPERKNLLSNRKWSEHCGECGCLLEGKVFTRSYDACPLHKWLPVEAKYLSEISIVKKNKTII